jgi:GNAT superfamily N-acetyltransferase
VPPHELPDRPDPRHPLVDLLGAAADGRPPEPDGAVDVLPPAPGPVDGVLGFPFHHVVVADVEPVLVRGRLPPADVDVGAPLKAPFLIWLAGWLGSSPGSVDLVLVAPRQPATDTVAVERRPDLAAHPRVRRAAAYRDDHHAYADGTGAGVVVVGRGLAARWEVSFEVDPVARGQGLGRRLASTAIALVPEGEPLFAQVAPANIPSLLALLGAGYRPMGAEVLFPRSAR